MDGISVLIKEASEAPHHLHHVRMQQARWLMNQEAEPDTQPDKAGKPVLGLQPPVLVQTTELCFSVT